MFKLFRIIVLLACSMAVGKVYSTIKMVSNRGIISPPSGTFYDHLIFTSLTHFANTSNFTSYATASYAPTNDANCILFASVNVSHATAPTAPTTCTGNGLTWTKIIDVAYNTTSTPTHHMSVWWAQGAGSAGVFKADWGATTMTGCAIEVVQLENALLGAGAIVQAVTIASNNTANPRLAFTATTRAGTNAFLKFGGDSVNSAADSTPDTLNRFAEIAEDAYTTPASGAWAEYSLSCVPTINSATNTATARDWAMALIEVQPRVWSTETNCASIFIHGDFQTTVGTMLTPALMTTATYGDYNVYNPFERSSAVVTPTNFLVGVSNTLSYLRTPIKVGPVHFRSTSNSFSMAYSNINNFHEGNISLSTPPLNLVLSVGGWITFGPTNAGAANGALFDYFKMKGDTSGEFCVMQLQNGIGASNGYCINIESNPGGVTTHSSYMSIVTNGTYWCDLQGDFLQGKGALAFYSNDVARTLVGIMTTTVSNSKASGDTDVTPFYWGNGEIGISTGISYFQNMFIDFRTQRFPIRP